MLDHPFSDIDKLSERISTVSDEVAKKFPDCEGEFGQIFIEASDIRTKLYCVYDENSPLENIGREVVRIISGIVEKVSMDLADHMKCVEHASIKIASSLGFDENRISDISMAASLHDFGKLWLKYKPWEINGPLNHLQNAQMKAHPILGECKLSGILPNPVLQIIARHHKNHDGSGYPKHLKPSDDSSLLHIADSLVVMATRKYNGNRTNQFTREQSSNELMSLRGTHFNPEIAELAADLLHEIECRPCRSVA